MAKFKSLAEKRPLNKLQKQYVENYSAEFRPIVDSVRSVILVGDGLPVDLWQEYFPNATILIGQQGMEAPQDLSLIVFDGTNPDKELLATIDAFWPSIPTGAIVSIENCGLAFDNAQIKDSLTDKFHPREGEKDAQGRSKVDAILCAHIASLPDIEWIKTSFNRWHILVKKGVMGSGE